MFAFYMYGRNTYRKIPAVQQLTVSNSLAGIMATSTLTSRLTAIFTTAATSSGTRGAATAFTRAGASSCTRSTTILRASHWSCFVCMRKHGHTRQHNSTEDRQRPFGCLLEEFTSRLEFFVTFLFLHTFEDLECLLTSQCRRE